MLEQHNDLIERLLRDSLTRTSEFNGGWTFTNDGTLYFTVWDKGGTTFFSWSERQPSTSPGLKTDCDSVAAYVLTTELGSMRAMALPFDVPRFPERLDQLHPSWVADKTPLPPALFYHRIEDPSVCFYSSSPFDAVPVTYAMEYDLEDILKKYMA
ncbi:hypothetical protein [Schaalia odontolytica]|uniref:Uncharacterized protein n=1 Tax=Schaalia odontolytica TaxID=1660 RepID=A0A2X0UEK2_9ACTO|nr:hypothetical protein [Schaalia odontolytica]WMS26932.1 hypothetical protein RDV55_07535 [Schaalia odontolytica]SPT55578.1 Uncharacterised protein [Schaalia odontolytica]